MKNIWEGDELEKGMLLEQPIWEKEVTRNLSKNGVWTTITPNVF